MSKWKRVDRSDNSTRLRLDLEYYMSDRVQGQKNTLGRLPDILSGGL